MAKKVTGYLKLQVPAGAANPSPPIGPALGQRGLNIMEFCKAFNAQTQKEEKNTPIPVIITIYADRSFTFEMKTPPMSYFLKQAAKIQSGSKAPGRDKAGKVTKAQVREIVGRVREEAAKHGREQDVRFSLSFRPILAETEEAARHLFRSRELQRTLRERVGFVPLPPPEEAEGFAYDEAELRRIERLREHSAVGTGEQVWEKLCRMAAEFRCAEVAVVTACHDPMARRRSYELLARAAGLAEG